MNKAITFTIIFEASALNRDEKIGGNILSIKTLTRFSKDIFSYISKNALRHYTYTTLNNHDENTWKPAECYSDGEVVQFDLSKETILTNAEIDTFGYMYTNNTPTLTRKGVLGITKAVALEKYTGDMQFNANHDLAKRVILNPDPVNKRENLSYFKVSFTLDCSKLGIDEWFVSKNPEFSNDILTVNLIKLDKKGKEETAKTKKIEIACKKESEIDYINEKGKIKIKNNSVKYYSVKFSISEEEKNKRINQIIHVIKNGLIYHVSGESWGIVPKFIISAGLDLPIPIFNSFVGLEEFDNEILENGYINKKDNKKLIYIYNSNNIVKGIDNKDTYSNWNAYLKDLGLSDEQSN